VGQRYNEKMLRETVEIEEGHRPSRLNRTGDMGKVIAASSVLFLIAVFITADLTRAEQVNKAVLESQPTYGHYWQGTKRGWYGAPREVRTPVEAKQILDQFFMHHDRGVKVVRIRERSHFFVAELISSKGVLIDMILIDKRTGRIRSMF
jgi:hypothetical protein